jgi:hypothetical protein
LPSADAPKATGVTLSPLVPNFCFFIAKRLRYFRALSEFKVALFARST